MSAAEEMEFVSVLGCTISLVPSDEFYQVRGAQLVLRMEQHGDTRTAVVVLNDSNVADLESMLHRWRTELAEKWANR